MENIKIGLFYLKKKNTKLMETTCIVRENILKNNGLLYTNYEFSF
jgi:hypothetical protein